MILDEGAREHESVLLAPRDGAAVLDAVARLRRLGSHRLRGAAPLRLRDRYFDTPEGALAARGLALRVRDCGGDRLLALKGERRAGGGIERLELERPWSAQALDDARASLRAVGVTLAGAALERADGRDPAAALCALGLALVQRLETRRRRRLFVLDGERPCAELDIDTVTYRVNDVIASLYEVEIEAKDPRFDVTAASSRLRARVPGLVPWPHNKLAVGIAVTDAVAAGCLTPTADGTLSAHHLDALGRAVGHAARLRT